MYVDDTTLFCNMNNNVDEHVINNELCKISEWLGANKLSLNISKTKFMVFHTSNRLYKFIKSMRLALSIASKTI